MATQTQTTTAEELFCMPNDGMRRELVYGELREMNPPGYRHGKVTGRVHLKLGSYVDEHGLGDVCAAETGFRLTSDPDTVRAPDVAFTRRERIEEVGEPDGYWPGAPDLVVEVVSPSDRYREVQEKVMDWLRAGAEMVIVADPSSRTVAVHLSFGEGRVLTEQDTLDGGDVVPGWRVPVRELFA